MQNQEVEFYFQILFGSFGYFEYVVYVFGMWVISDFFLKFGSFIWLLKRVCYVDELFKFQQYLIYVNSIICLRVGWFGIVCRCDIYYYYYYLVEKLVNLVESGV